jgi:hypothetical protein
MGGACSTHAGDEKRMIHVMKANILNRGGWKV